MAEKQGKRQQDIILIVDDHPTALRMLQTVLAKLPYEIVTAENGERALEQAHKYQPSLILLDIMMPDIDGFEVCRRLKANEATRDAAVIFLSGLEDSDVKVKGFSVGAVDYINKPFSGPEVVARVQTHMRTKLLESRLARQNDELEAQNQLILATINEGIVNVSRSGLISLVNKAAEEQCGWRNHSLIDRPIADLFHDSDPRLLHDIVSLDHPFEREAIELQRRDGSTFPASLSVTPIKENGGISGAVLVFKDITLQLEQEEALQNVAEELKSQRERLAHIERLSTMGEMAAGFAHEVNQPLTAIANYARVSVRFADQIEPRPDKLIEILNKMEAQSLRASEVITRLRNFVKRPVDGRLVLSPDQLIEEIVQLAEVDARNNGVQIHVDLNAANSEIFVDPIQIQQVALNLIRNGLEAMSDSEFRKEGLWVSTQQLDDCVRFEVRDRGIGLAPGAEDELFNPFYTTKSNGMGIGLSVCMSIIKDHRGEIGFERRSEGGTLFWFELPYADPA